MDKRSKKANAAIDENASRPDRDGSEVSTDRTVRVRTRCLDSSWTVVAELLIGVILVMVMAMPVRSETATKILQHEWHLNPEVFGYIEFKGALFYGDDASLYRLDSLNSEPIELPLPTPPEWTSPSPLFETFIEVDDALFFHALCRSVVDSWYGSGNYLHRISDRFGQPELSDIQKETIDVGL